MIRRSSRTDLPADGRTRLNVLLVGEESAGIQALRLIAGSGHRLAMVLASPSKESKTTTLWNTANKLGFTTRPARLVKQADFAKEIQAHHIDLLLNVHSLYVINADVLNAPRIGAFNLHPGPLPEMAGLNVPSWAIYQGATEHAVTVHEMRPRIDAGDVVYRKRLVIEEHETGLSLMSKCVRAGVPLLAKLLEAASQGPESIPRIKQDFACRSYLGREAPDEGRLSWNRPALEIVNHVRAADYSPFVSPWGHPRTCLNGREIGIVKALRIKEPAGIEAGTVGEHIPEGVLVAANDEWVLVQRIEVDGECLRPHQVFLSGNRFEEPNLVTELS